MRKLAPERLISRKWARQVVFGAGSILLAWLGATLFVAPHLWQMMLALPFGLLVSGGLSRWLASRQLLSTLEQFRRLLEHLLARLTAGITLEMAFSEAPSCLEPLLGKRSALYTALLNLDLQLTARQPLDRLLPALEKSLPCPEAVELLRILTPLRHSGGNIIQYLRQGLHLVVERINLLQDIAAETTQRRTEATILTLMPFAMTLLLRNTAGYDQQEFAAAPAYQIGMIVCYGLAMLAASITLSLINRPSELPKLHAKQFSPKMQRRHRLHLPRQMLVGIYKDYLPETYGLRLVHILREPVGFQVERHQAVLPILDEFFRQKCLFSLVGLLTGLGLMLIFPGQWFWPLVLTVGCNILQDQQVFRLARGSQLACRLEYPILINLVTVLLQAGLSLYAALTICLKILPQILESPIHTGCPKRPVICANISPRRSQLAQDLQMIERQLQLGIPVDRLLETVSPHLPVPEIQAALLLMARYGRTGGQEILNLLQMQSASCWSVYRQSARRQIEQRAVLLLLPMMLDLLAVIIAAMLPALLSISVF